MRILATPDEVTAVGEAIAHYLNYISLCPAFEMTKERREAVVLLARFQMRLTVKQNDEIEAERTAYEQNEAEGVSAPDTRR